MQILWYMFGSNKYVFYGLVFSVISTSTFSQVSFKDKVNGEVLVNRLILVNDTIKRYTSNEGELAVKELPSGPLSFKTEGFQEFEYLNTSSASTIYLVPEPVKLREVFIDPVAAAAEIEIGYISLKSRRRLATMQVAETARAGVILDIPTGSKFLFKKMFFGTPKQANYLKFKASIWTIDEFSQKMDSQVAEIEAVGVWNQKKKAYVIDVSENRIIVEKNQVLVLLEEVNNQKNYSLTVTVKSRENQPNRTIVTPRKSVFIHSFTNGFFTDSKGNHHNLRIGATIIPF